MAIPALHHFDIYMYRVSQEIVHLFRKCFFFYIQLGEIQENIDGIICIFPKVIFSLVKYKSDIFTSEK